MEDENRKMLDTLKHIAKIFNEAGITYALCGGLVLELVNGKIDFHKDIDFAILANEKKEIDGILTDNNININKIKYETFTENIINTIAHNFTAKDTNGTDIGFFVFDYYENKKTGEEIFSRTQAYRNKYNETIVMSENFMYEMGSYLFNKDNQVKFEGVPIKIQPIEYILYLKHINGRIKDKIHTENAFISNEQIAKIKEFSSKSGKTYYYKGNLISLKEALDGNSGFRKNIDALLSRSVDEHTPNDEGFEI